MQIYDSTVCVIILGLSLGVNLGPAFAFDGKPRTPAGIATTDAKPPLPSTANLAPAALPTNAPVTSGNLVKPGIDMAIPRPPAAIPNVPAQQRAVRAPAKLTAVEAFQFGAKALSAGETEKGVSSLQYAAENGHPIAQWKLGRMYADGTGVKRDELRAFEYFRGIANAHADDSPSMPQARFVANAFVALGQYYRDGIPNTEIKADPGRAREMFGYAASYFGDADAQYQLGRLYLDGKGYNNDPLQAARWLRLAARKGHREAQAVFGHMLFKGDKVRRQGARGLMWLMLARDAATANDVWITKLYDAAVKQATNDEQAMALVYLERWLQTRRE
jgi:TPR repeat protein